MDVVAEAESPHKRVVGDVRAQLARRRVSARQVAFALGWTEHYMSRRLTGKTPFDVNDLYALAQVLDVSILTFLQSLDDHQVVHRTGLGLGSTNWNWSPPSRYRAPGATSRVSSSENRTQTSVSQAA